MRTAVLVSGGGTNLQALLNAYDRGEIKSAKIVCVVSNKRGAYALERVKDRDIKTAVITKKEYGENFEDELIRYLNEQEISLVVLAGFTAVLGEKFIRAFENRIINVHPSLIPSFCGKGYYGIRVHEKALEYGVKVTGATVHFVSEVVDGGAVILQKAVEIKEDDTPETLQKRVMEQAEWQILPKAVELVASGRVKIEGRKTKILGGTI